MHELSQIGKQMSIRMCHHVQLLLVTFNGLKLFNPVKRKMFFKEYLLFPFIQL
jgi:hypothetical protein